MNTDLLPRSYWHVWTNTHIPGRAIKWWYCWGNNLTDKFQTAFLWSSAGFNYVNPHNTPHWEETLYLEAFVFVSHAPFQLLIICSFIVVKYLKLSSCSKMYLKKGTRQGVGGSPWQITKSKAGRKAEYISPNRFISKNCTPCFKKFLVQF